MCVRNKHGPEQILPPSTFQNMLKQKIILATLKHCNDLNTRSSHASYNRLLKQRQRQQRRWQQRQRQKQLLVLLARQQLCPTSCFSVYFFDVHCTTMTWNLLIFKAVFYGGHECATINFPFSFWTWIKSLRIQLQEKLPSFDQLKESTRHDKVWKDTNSFFSDVFPTTVVIKKMVSLQNRTAQTKRRGQQNVCVWQIWQGENL